MISVAADILERLGILDRCVLKINSLGDPESRTVYRKVLVDYYSGHVARLSEDSRDRLQRNPLRILDSKDEGDKAINANAPSFADHLNQASRDFFTAVQDGSQPPACRSRSIRAWCAASTITPTPPSSS